MITMAAGKPLLIRVTPRNQLLRSQRWKTKRLDLPQLAEVRLFNVEEEAEDIDLLWSTFNFRTRRVPRSRTPYFISLLQCKKSREVIDADIQPAPPKCQADA